TCAMNFCGSRGDRLVTVLLAEPLQDVAAHRLRPLGERVEFERGKVKRDRGRQRSRPIAPGADRELRPFERALISGHEFGCRARVRALGVMMDAAPPRANDEGPFNKPPTVEVTDFRNKIGTFATSTDVRSTAAFGECPDIERTSPNDRLCRVGPGNFTPSPSQNRT